jgi:hypothetical protein
MIDRALRRWLALMGPCLGLSGLLSGCSSPSSSSDGGSPADGGQDAAGAAFRSLLYPPDWEPALTADKGRFLHDFSYAGYRNGEAPLPTTVSGPVVDVTAAPYRADATGASDATAAIQAAIDAVSGGGVVFLPRGLYRCDGTLSVRASGVVLRGEGPQTRIYFTRGPGAGDRSHITFQGMLQRGPDRRLARDGQARSHEVFVSDASTLRIGDDISIGWVISPEFVAEHNMTGTWMAFNGTWRPFFRRRVVAIDTADTPHRVTLDVPLRYPAKLRDSASLRVETGYLRECGIESLAISNAVTWAEAWAQPRVHAVAFVGVKDGWLRAIESFASPLSAPAGYHLQSGGLYVLDSKRITIADSKLEKAQNRGEGGAGYLFEVSASSEVLIRDSTGRDGRHNFIQNWDFGATGLVFLRTETAGSRAYTSSSDSLGLPAASEYHHSLTMACLVDHSRIDDAWQAVNRGSYSSGAGLTATQNVFWNSRGSGRISSYQFGDGYVIGTQGISVDSELPSIWPAAAGAAPNDYVEGLERGSELQPPSLYEDQLQRRLARGTRLW